MFISYKYHREIKTIYDKKSDYTTITKKQDITKQPRTKLQVTTKERATKPKIMGTIQIQVSSIKV
jgi:hypothetical protein